MFRALRGAEPCRVAHFATSFLGIIRREKVSRRAWVFGCPLANLSLGYSKSGWARRPGGHVRVWKPQMKRVPLFLSKQGAVQPRQARLAIVLVTAAALMAGICRSVSPRCQRQVLRQENPSLDPDHCGGRCDGVADWLASGGKKGSVEEGKNERT